jgi:hypothetical protein
VLLLFALASWAWAEDADSGEMAEREYVLAVKLLREQHEQIEHAVARLERLERAHDYLRRILRNPRISAEDKKPFRRQDAYFKAEARLVKQYINKTAATYLKNVEGYIGKLQEQYPQFKLWERARKGFWKGNRPRMKLGVTPCGKIPTMQPLRLTVEGAPRGSYFTWETTAGGVDVDEDAKPPRSVAVWHSRGRTGAIISVRVSHPRLPMPVMLYYTVIAVFGGVSPGVERGYEDALAKLIAIETGGRLLEEESEQVQVKLRRARKRGAPSDSATMTHLNGRRRELRDQLEANKDWIEYLDAYLLPHLADADRSGAAAAWERQRLELRELAADDRTFPWQIQRGEKMSPERWHFVVPGLPPETEVRWTVQTEHDRQVGEEGRRLAGDAEDGVLVDPPRSQELILSAHVKLHFYTLPIRLDWVLPPTEVP